MNRLALLLIAPMVLVLTGCVTEGPPVRRKPRNIPEPAGLMPARILLNAGPFPEDADGNGYADTFSISVFLFPAEDRHPIPIHSTGMFVFMLSTEGGEPIAEWRLEGREEERARVTLLPGPGYIFELNINDVASDRLLFRTASLRCSFIPVDGDPIDVRGPANVRVGRTGAG